MAREMKHWTELFTLKCADRDNFLAFYSTAKKLLHKLTVSNSVVVPDDVFLKVFMAKAIKVPELQSESKKFLMDGSGTYTYILEKICADYRTQETGEQIRDGNTTPDTQLRRASIGATEIPKKVKFDPP